MSAALIDSVKAIFTDIILSKFSVLLGETESNTRKAVHAAVPMALTQILYKAGGNEGAAQVYELSKEAAGGDFFGSMHHLSTNSGGLTAGSALLNKGTGFTAALFAGRKDNAEKEVSRYAGISVQSAAFITGVAGFAALDAIGRQIAGANLDVKGMVQWLAAQRDTIIHAIPAGLQVKGALGLNHYPGEKAEAARRKTSLFVVVTIIVILIVVFLVYKSCNRGIATTAAGTGADTSTTASMVPANTVKIQDTLSTGNVITVYRGGTEDQLISFLSDPNAKLDGKNGNWFNFTGISFDRNSANLLLESETQLQNIVAILAAFPKAKIEIGGFSDNTGDAGENIKLSQQRADNGLAKLKDLGAKPSQLRGAKGYGPAYPIGDNGTEAGRALNRRMAINVKDK